MMKIEIIEKFSRIPRNIKIASIGTTQCHYAFDFNDSEGFDFSCYLNPFPFSRLLLEKHKENISPGAFVFITLQYPIFCIDSYEKCGKANIQQYTRLLFLKNPYCSKLEQICARLMPFRDQRMIEVQKTYKSIEERSVHRNHFKPWEINRMCKELIINGWEKEIGVENYVMYEHLCTNEIVQKAMLTAENEVVDLIEFCRHNEWHPILLGLPYSRALNDFVPGSFKRKCFYDRINRVVERTKCEFWDYSDNKDFESIHYYLDVWFLNKRGRDKFTREIIKRIRILNFQK